MDDIPPPPVRISVDTMMAELADLYAQVLPSGKPIIIEVDPFSVDDNIQGEEDISEAVLRLQLHHVGGPSIIRDEHLRMWLCTAMQE